MTTTFTQMKTAAHERVCYHYDKETGLCAIIAIHSTTLGPALGGTRRWHYNSESNGLNDVLRLSEGMTYKAAAANLPMGGAKSIILTPTPNHTPTENEARAMGRFVDTFKGTYIAAEDVGVDTKFVDWMALETNHVMGGEVVSRGGDPSPYTAKGVFEGLCASLNHQNIASKNMDGLHVAIQGIGHVGWKLAKNVVEAGGRVSVADIDVEAVDHCVEHLGATPLDINEILTCECDVLAPCALGGVISSKNISDLKCKIICGGANNILVNPETDSTLLKDAGITYAPDFVVNAGGLIQLAGLWLGYTEKELQQKNSEIYQTTLTILETSSSNNISTYQAALDLAQARIQEKSDQCKTGCGCNSKEKSLPENAVIGNFDAN